MAQTGLGKGLSALLSEPEEVAVAPAENQKSGDVTWLSLSQLQVGEYQPRRDFAEDELRELASSIRAHGVLQPIVVRPIRGEDGMYEIIAGERRWRASSLAGQMKIPALIRSIGNKQALEIALIENVQRENLNPLEEAMGYKRLLDEFGYTQEQLATSVSKNRSTISNAIRLLSLPEAVQDYVLSGTLSAGHARALLSSSDPVALAQKAVKKKLNVRQVEKLVQQEQGKGEAADSKDDTLNALEKKLSDMMGIGMRVQPNAKGGGKLVVSYDSPAELATLLETLGANKPQSILDMLGEKAPKKSAKKSKKD